jgi:hypothetical protein
MAGSVRVVLAPDLDHVLLAEMDTPLEEILEAVADDMRRGVPVDTGRLKLSIAVLGIVNHVGRVGAGRSEDGTDEYAGVVEGVRPKPNPNYPYQPFMRPALYRLRVARGVS